MHRIATSLLICSSFTSVSLTNADDGFVDLFNGKSLDGWKTVVESGSDVDPDTLFIVTDGSIHAYPGFKDGSTQPFGGIYTEAEYADYHLILEYKWAEARFAPRANAQRDAGLLFHVIGDAKIWPTSVECQIQEGDTGDIWIIGQTRTSSYVSQPAQNYFKRGDLVTRGAGLGAERFPRGSSREIEGWNQVEVIVEGNNAVFKVNGHVVNEAIHMRYREDENSEWDWQPLTKGRIFLQAEGAELFYRNIRLKPLGEN